MIVNLFKENTQGISMFFDKPPTTETLTKYFNLKFKKEGIRASKEKEWLAVKQAVAKESVFCSICLCEYERTW